MTTMLKTSRRGFLTKRPIALIDVEEIGRAEPADVQIRPAVIVDVRERHPLFPRSERATDAVSWNMAHALAVLPTRS